jgi:hypothetical protein
MSKMHVPVDQSVISPEWVGIILKQIGSLRFGVVQITVHDSRVVQIEKTEKVRLGEPRESKQGLTYQSNWRPNDMQSEPTGNNGGELK